MSTVATVTSLSGGAAALRGGVTVPLAEGMPLEQGDVLVTGEGAKLAVRFNDDAVIELGGNSRVQVKDFMFEPQEQLFSLHMLEGVVRSVSGKVVEQNPEAFTLSSPMGIVGIRGTETMHLISSKFEMHSVLSLDEGHTVVITTADGRTVVISESLKGVIIALGNQSALEQIDVTPDMLEDYLKMMEDLGYLYNDPSGLFVLADAAFMAELGAYDLLGGTGFLPMERMGSLLTALADVDESLSSQAGVILGGSGPVPPAPTPPGVYSVFNGSFMNFSGSAYNDTLILNSGNNNTLYGGTGDDRIVLTVGSGGSNVVYGGYGSWDHIIVERSVTDEALFGDVATLPRGARGDDDLIEVFGDMLSTAEIYGDAELGGEYGALGGDLAYGGNDTIIIHGDHLGGDIFGDFKGGGQVDSTVCGDDSILIKGDVTGSIYGDMMGYTYHPGSDTIHVTGSLGGSGRIYADTASLSPGACHNLITVDGDMMNSEIHGSVDGHDTVTIGGEAGDMALIDTYGGNDSVSIGTAAFAIVNLGDGNDTLRIGQVVDGGGATVSGGAGNDQFIFSGSVTVDPYGGTPHIGKITISDFGVNNQNGYGNDILDVSGITTGSRTVTQHGSDTHIIFSGSNEARYTIVLENVFSSDLLVGQNFIV